MLAKEGVTRYDALGQPFDPNLHDALFEVPDATKEPGTCAVVIKVGCWMGAMCLLLRGAAFIAEAVEPPGPCNQEPPPLPPSSSSPQRGYMLNERVVRAAEVGVARAVDE